MAATVDFAAVFAQKLTDLDIGHLKQKLADKGWTTFGDFAFACSSPPGGDNELFEKQVVVPILGEDRTAEAKLRQ